MKVNYPTTSPYSITPQTTWHLGRYRHIPVYPFHDDTPFKITPEYEHRPDKLSLKLYGSDSYWWIFMSRNLKIIRDPIWDFKSGAVIMVPTAERVRSIAGAK